MTTNKNDHSGTPAAAGQAANPGTKGDPSDAAIAGSAGNTGSAGSEAGADMRDTGAGSDAGGAQRSMTGDGSGQGGAAAGGGEMTRPRSTGQAGGSVAKSTGFLVPPVDVIEDANGITLLADMPGVSKDNLDLRLETNSLTINAALSVEVPQGMESRYAEVKHQQYQRTFALSKELDGEQATAELTHGVLKIRIPKTAHAQPRRVQIKVA